MVSIIHLVHYMPPAVGGRFQRVDVSATEFLGMSTANVPPYFPVILILAGNHLISHSISHIANQGGGSFAVGLGSNVLSGKCPPARREGWSLRRSSLGECFTTSLMPLVCL